MRVESFADEVAESHINDCEEADELLRAIVQAGRQPKHAEAVFFARECGWDETEIKRQLRRMTSVLRLQAVAGTAADREAAQAEAATARALAEKEGPRLQAKIEELQEKLNSLERDARLASKRVEDQADAVARLRGLVPLHVAEQIKHQTQAIKATIGRELRDAEVRANELECCLNPSRYPSEQAYLESLQRSFRAAVIEGTQGKIIVRRLSPEWPVIRASIENELIELQGRMAELQKEYQAAIAAAEKPLSLYSGE